MGAGRWLGSFPSGACNGAMAGAGGLADGVRGGEKFPLPIARASRFARCLVQWCNGLAGATVAGAVSAGGQGVYESRSAGGRRPGCRSCPFECAQ